MSENDDLRMDDVVCIERERNLDADFFIGFISAYAKKYAIFRRKRDYKIAVVSTGSGDIIGSTKKYHDN